MLSTSLPLSVGLAFLDFLGDFAELSGGFVLAAASLFFADDLGLADRSVSAGVASEQTAFGMSTRVVCWPSGATGIGSQKEGSYPKRPETCLPIADNASEVFG